MKNVNVSNALANALDLAYQFQKGSNPHGKTKVTYSQSKLYRVGTKVNRASTGASFKSHHVAQMPICVWNIVVSYMTKVEKVYFSFINSDEICRIKHACDVVPFKL